MLVMLKYLFGTRTGGVIAIIVIGVIGLAGFAAVNTLGDPTTALYKADKEYESDKVDAVKKYKELLLKRALFNNSEPFVPQERRHILYRRIISFEAVYGDPAEARDWITTAWNDKIRNLVFERKEATDMWNEVTLKLQGKSPVANLPESRS